MRYIVLASLLASSVVAADRGPWTLEEQIAAAQSLAGAGDVPPISPPRFAFLPDRFVVNANDAGSAIGAAIGALPAGRRDGTEPLPHSSAKASDGAASWLSADLGEFDVCAVAEACAHSPAIAFDHVVVLFDNGAKGQPIIWHVAHAIGDADQAKLSAKGARPAELPRRIDSGADDAVAVFQASIGDPAALAKTVSDRKDVVLYGSSRTDRYEGGAKVRDTLKAWKLAFKLRDGIQAGLTSSKTVAWVAANVDASFVDKPKAKSVPYRVLALYEKTGGAWQVVSLSFSFPN